MDEVTVPADGRSCPPYAFEIWLPLAIVALDQLSKELKSRRGLDLHESATIVPGIVDFVHVRNAGAAFGILNSAAFPYKTVFIVLIASAGLIGVAMLSSASLASNQLAARVGLALIIGGADGNLIDRIVVGYVVDFVDVYWREYHFWAFNVADSAITIGVVIMILDMLGRARACIQDCLSCRTCRSSGRPRSTRTASYSPPRTWSASIRDGPREKRGLDQTGSSTSASISSSARWSARSCCCSIAEWDTYARARASS